MLRQNKVKQLITADGIPISNNSLALIASALAGKTVAVCFMDTPHSYTDGYTIFLPNTLSTENAFCSLCVQAVLLSDHSFKIDILKKLIGNKKLANRYLCLEAIRVIKHKRHFIPYKIERLILNNASIENNAMPDAHSPEESLTIAQSNILIAPLAASYGVLYPWKIIKALGLDNAMHSLNRKMKVKDGGIMQMQDGEDETTNQPKTLKWLSSTVPMDNFLTRFLRDQIFNAKRSPQTGSGDSSNEIAVASTNSVSHVDDNAPSIARSVDIHELALFKTPQASSYPEWDRNLKKYRQNWCSVSEMDPASSEDNDSTLATHDYELQRGLARLGLALEAHNYQSDGETLHLPALIDYTIARKAGGSIDERVYSKRLKTAHDLSVLVLLDASGSLAEKNADNLQVWQQQIELANNLVSGFEQVGDRVAAYAFRSYGRDDVRFLRIKEFHTEFDFDSKSRLNAIQASGFTRLGAALRHATKTASTEGGSSNTLVVLISDGLPYEDGYEGKYAQEDTRKAIEEANNIGVACVCLALGSTVKNKDLLGFKDNVNFLQMSDPYELGQQVECLFKSAIQHAITASYAKAS